MRPYYASRSGFNVRFPHLLLCAFVTGCHSESFRGEFGSGYKIGIAVVPAAAFAAILLILLGYFLWRQSGKR